MVLADDALQFCRPGCRPAGKSPLAYCRSTSPFPPSEIFLALWDRSSAEAQLPLRRGGRKCHPPVGWAPAAPRQRGEHDHPHLKVEPSRGTDTPRVAATPQRPRGAIARPDTDVGH